MVKDHVRGEVRVPAGQLEDLVILRSDGTPTYNFTVVVDDWDMKVSHVMRGDDHINNTPRQINILRALGATPPLYAHLPMILGPDGKRLSKRDGAASVMDYRDEGILPEALLNYLVRLGWSHGDQEIFSILEMTMLFDIQDLNKAPTALNPEKLLWLNQHYMKTQNAEEVAKRLFWHMEKLGIDIQNGPALEDIVKAQCERVKTLKEMAERSRFFYGEIEYDAKAREHLTPDLAQPLTAVRDRMSELADWSPEAIHQVITSVAEQHQLKLGKLAQPLRVAVTGGTVSPPIDMTVFLIGQERVTNRLNQVLAFK